MQFDGNAACTRMGKPATNGSARGITGTPVPPGSRSWFYPVGVFAARTSCHDVQDPTAGNEHSSINMPIFRVNELTIPVKGITGKSAFHPASQHPF